MAPGRGCDQVIDHQALVCEECWSNIFSTDAVCAFWQRESGAYEYTADFLHVLEASKHGCQWCKAFLSIIKLSSWDEWLEEWGNKKPDAKQTTMFRARLQWSRITTLDSEPSDECVLFVGDYRHRFEIAWYNYGSNNPLAGIHTAIGTKHPRPDLSSDEVFEQAQHWIETCKGHRNCLQQSNDPLPNMVIEVPPPGSIVPCRLLESGDLFGQYTALSYCWGQQSYVLTTENKKDLMIELDETRLPQTILDAIHITRRLGYQFLWIDAFCIMQDSAKEKAEEIANMNKTYQRAALTIVAGSANSASEGFLHPKRPISHMLTDVQLNANNEFKIPCKCTADVYVTVGVKQLEPSSSFMDPILGRAWTLQETLLSPRLLSYSCHTLTWHCSSASFKVDDWYRPDRDSYESLAQNLTVSRGHQEVSRKWDTIVKLYTYRALTVSEDKLPALAALAAVFFPALGPNYLAGIWQTALPEALLWTPRSGYPEAEYRSFTNSDAYLNRFARRSKTYRAPTWSWASIDGFVVYDYGVLENSGICEIVKYEIIPKYPDVPFGEVISAYIRIRGRTKQLYLRPRKDMAGLVSWLDCDSPTNVRRDFGPWSSEGGLINIDTEEDLYERTIQCIPIAKVSDRIAKYDTQGLVLGMDGGSVYKRIGTFEGFEKDFEGIEKEVVTIV